MVLYIDGIMLAEHMAVCALEIDIDGRKHVPGLWEDAAENKEVANA